MNFDQIRSPREGVFIELNRELNVVYLGPGLEQGTNIQVEIGSPFFDHVQPFNVEVITEWLHSPGNVPLELPIACANRNYWATLTRYDNRVCLYIFPLGTEPLVERLTKLLDLNPNLMAVFKSDGSCYASNVAWKRLFSDTEQQTPLQSLLKLIDKGIYDENRSVEALCLEAYNSANPSNLLKDSTGSDHFINWSFSSDAGLQVIYAVGVDDTEAYSKALQAERDQKLFEEKYASKSIGVCQTDLFGRYIRVNESFSDLVGYPGKELIGKHFADITHPEDIEKDLGQSDLLVAGDISRYGMEKRYIRKDGKTQHAYLSVTLTRDEKYAPRFFTSVVSDISRKALADLTLPKNAEFFRQFLDPNDRTYWTANVEGEVIDISDNGGLTTGVTPEELLSNGWQQILCPLDLERVVQTYRSAIAGGKRFFCEYRIRAIDGHHRWVRSQALPHLNNAGEVEYWYGYTDDIQMQKITEDELATLVEERTQELTVANKSLTEARDAALAASLAKSQFLANMSHEIRTPMNGVLGIASLLREQELNAKCQGMVDIIYQCGESLVKIIDDILDFSKIEAGKVSLDPTPTDLGELVSELIGLFQGHAKSKQIDLSLKSELSPVPTVLVDQLRFRQVISNLLSNAIKFTSAGAVKVRISGGVKNDLFALSLTIEDTGIGIPPESMKSIFESFTQVDGSTQRKFGGTGLGLTISKHLIELMGGTLTPVSQVGKGTTMTVRLELPVVVK